MIRLRILGPIELRDGQGHELTSILAQPKRLAILARLAVADGFLRRDSLLATFWPEADEAHARSALNQALRFLRRELGASNDVIVSRGAEELGVDRSQLWCDVAAFRSELAAGRFADVLHLYRGHFLEGFFTGAAPAFDEWVDEVRSTLRAAAVRSAHQHAEARERAGGVQDAILTARRAVQLAGADECAVRQLMQLLARLGDRAGAVHAYEEFASRVARDYDTAVSNETRTLAATIRGQEEPAVAGSANAIAHVSPTPAPTSGFPGLPQPMALARPSGWWHRPKVALGFGALALGAFVFLAWTSLPERRTGFAVLPCDNISRGADPSSLGERYAEELVIRFARVEGLQPTSYTASRRYPLSRVRPRDVADSLGVRTLVRCAVIEDTGGVRFSAEIIDGDAETILWSREYEDVSSAGANVVQAAAARDIATFLTQSALSEEARVMLDRPLTRDTAALRLYRVGRHLLREFQLNLDPSVRDRAAQHFDSALARDSAFAHALLWMVDARSAFGNGYPPQSSQLHLLVEKVIALDSSIAFAYAARAMYLVQRNHDWRGAAANHRRALALDPNDMDVLWAYSWFLRVSGRPREAVPYLLRAKALEPANPFIRSSLLHALTGVGDTTRAMQEVQEALAVIPAYPPLTYILARTLILRGKRDSALLVLDNAPMTIRNAWLYASLGQPGPARAVLDSLTVLGAAERVSPLQLAILHAALGHRTEALDLLERAYEEGYAVFEHLADFPFFDSLRSEPRFRALRQRVGLAS